MLQGHSREFAKRLLFLSRVKLVYDRITLTRYTSLYFFFTLFSCLLLCSLQGVLLYDNTTAVRLLSSVVHQANVPPHIGMLMDGRLQICDSIPDRQSTNCTVILDLGDLSSGPAMDIGLPLERRLYRRQSLARSAKISRRDDDPSDIDDETEDSGDHHKTRISATLASSTVPTVSLNCVYSLSWLEESLHDSQREDVATLCFQLWLFTIGLVAILNESLPHLGAAFFGHILGGAWSSSRIQSTRKIASIYRNLIVPGPCGGVDLLGSWWEVRLIHTIPVVVANGVGILALAFFSWKLFKVYANMSFSRVGASAAVNRMYKLVLFESVALQLASFFSLASTAIWIAKITHGNIKVLSEHANLYLAAFIVILVAQLPWLVLGWVCVRRECKISFTVFIFISAILIAVSSLMFSSNLYRCIFMSWQFFATLTVTSFVFLVITTGLGIICYTNYGKGLKHFLQVKEALEGEDFTPVYFPRKGGKEGGSQLVVHYADEKRDLERLQPPEILYSSMATMAKNKRGSSVYSDNLDSPIIMSSSPPLISDLASPTHRTMKRITRTLRKSWSDLSTSTEGSGGETGVVRATLVIPPPAIMAANRFAGLNNTALVLDQEPRTLIRKASLGSLSSEGRKVYGNAAPVEEMPSLPTRF